VSKCFYEGEFTVYCNKTKLPASSVSGSSDSTPEVMRYARLTKGLQPDNETLCSYVPHPDHCVRESTHPECVDKPFCKVENSWASLKPKCDGNSYYSQLDYDCQPAYHMCDDMSVASINAFSGLIYSPHYPRNFRSERIEPCYLTVNLPKNHHVEITLDHFDLLKTPNCIGDYVEIQQYIKVSASSNADYLSGKFVSNKRFKSYLTNNNNSHAVSSTTGGPQQSNGGESGNTTRSSIIRLNKQLLSGKNSADTMSKMFRPQQQQQQQPSVNHYAAQSSSGKSNGGSRQPKRAEYKWHTLVTVCGKIEKGYTIRATENTINFKFRPLPASHTYLANVNRQFQGFKIFFQAVPPKPIAADELDEERPWGGGGKRPSTKNASTTAAPLGSGLTTKVFDMDPLSEASGKQDDASRSRTILKSKKTSIYFSFL
jgi:hypothetical protein